MKTQAAIDCRKDLIARFGMDKNTPFIDVAKRLIGEDRLLVEFEIDSREKAIAFLSAYRRIRCVRGLSDEAAQHVR